MNELILVPLFIALGVFLTLLGLQDKVELHTEITKHTACAYFAPDTGKFTWKEEQRK